MRRFLATVGTGVLLLAMAGPASAGQPSSGLVYKFQDVRAVWSRNIAPCVDEGVFFGFHQGLDLHRMPGFQFLGYDKIAGMWWWQNNTCTNTLLFFRTADVTDPPPTFTIDNALGSASANVTIPISDGVTTYTFTFDLSYSATAKPEVTLQFQDVLVLPGVTPPQDWFGSGLKPDPNLYRQSERAAPASVTDSVTTDIPGGWTGMDLAWSEIASFTRVEINP